MYTEYLDYPTAIQWVAWPCQSQHVESSKPSLTHKSPRAYWFFLTLLIRKHFDLGILSSLPHLSLLFHFSGEMTFLFLGGSEVCTPRHGLSFALYALVKIMVTATRPFTTNNPYIYYFNPKRKAQRGQYERSSRDRLTFGRWSALSGGEVKTRRQLLPKMVPQCYFNPTGRFLTLEG